MITNTRVCCKSLIYKESYYWLILVSSGQY